ncbi:MAG: hypothetical protein IPK88_04280 [Saprospiraceae bacterium]|nr:hypothetical protein [Candidatus Defluviibacterium haderslevense]
MMKITVTLDSEPTYQKPKKGDEVRKWSVRLGSTSPSQMTISDFVEFVGNQCYSFNPAICNYNWIIEENFNSSQLIIIDVDKKLSLGNAINRLIELELPMPNGIYRTLSDPTDNNLPIEEKLKLAIKYRLIFVLDRVITNFDEYNNLVRERMQKIFPEADKLSCVQKFYGGKDLLYKQDTTLLSSLLLISVSDLYQTKHIESTQGVRKALKNKKNAAPNKHQEAKNLLAMPYLSDSTTTNSYNYTKELVINEPPIRNFDWEKARLEFKLLDDFLSMNIKIYHSELLGLYSGMRRIEGGAKKWKEAIQNNKSIDERKEYISDWFDINYTKGTYIFEQKISNYATNDPASLIYERLTDLHFKKRMEAQKLLGHPEISLKQAEMEMDSFLKQAIETPGNGKYILKAITGIGKTEKLLSLNLDGCIIAAPTHKLKEEIAKRYRNLGRTVLVTPEIPKLPEAIQQEYDKLQAIGDYEGAASYLKECSSSDIANTHFVGSEIMEFRKKMNNYFKELDTCLNSDQLVITTHKRILFSDFPNHHTIIFDEDPTQYILETNSFTTKDLRIIQDELNDTDQKAVQQLLDLANSNDNLNMVHQGNPLKITDMAEFRKKINSNKVFVKGAILPSFKCDYWMATPENLKDTNGDKKIHYIQKHKLYPDKKLIILSATTNETFCKALYGKIIWKDLSSVKHTGSRIQYSNLSLSRSTLGNRNNASNLNSIRNLIVNKPIITYIKHRNLFPDSNTKIHFGNCSGYDEFKGEDIAVIGTPHIPSFIYLLVASELNIQFNQNDIEMGEQTVCHNGFQFKIMTFPHEELRSIQFHFIESELLQACGRNRTLREVATTYLFSNYPLPGFEQHNIRELPQLLDENNIKEEVTTESQSQNTFQYGIVSGSL